MNREQVEYNLVTFKTVDVTVRLGERLSIESRSRDHVLYIDQSKSAGGEDAGPTPLECLFLSLVASVGSIGRIITN